MSEQVKNETASKEQAEREAKEKAFQSGQLTLMVEIGVLYGTMEKNRSKDLLSVARKCADYVDNAMRHASEKEKAKAFSTAVGEIETGLRNHTDETVGVSRLLGVYGLALVVDDKELIGKVPVSILKVLLPLISRDTTSPGLAYTWKSPEVQAASLELIRKAAEGDVTVKAAGMERDKILSKAAGETPVATDAKDKPAGRTPVEKAAGRIAKVLKDADAQGGSEARSETVKRLVNTQALSATDIVSALKAFYTAKDVDGLKRVLTAGKLLLEKLAAKRDANKERKAEAAGV